MSKAKRDKKNSSANSDVGLSDLKLLEYEQTMEGYRSADVAIPQEFSSMLNAFGVFVVLITAAKSFLPYNDIIVFLTLLLLSISGLVCFLAFLVDIQATASCKTVIRARATKIEKELGRLCHWKNVHKRRHYFEEHFFKRRHGEKSERTAANGFIFAGRTLLIFWVLYCFLVLVY